MGEQCFAGSCLCGSVAYETSGTVLHFYHCHCERCRKATGAAHASNIIFRPTAFGWTAGESLVRTYKVPEARYFTNYFCSVCGSRLPRFDEERGIGVVPAGSLDSEPDVAPEARIFAGSRAIWSCDNSDLPTFDAYPPRRS